MRKQWAIVDLDGTVFDIRHREELARIARRQPHPEQRHLAWEAFHAQCDEDGIVSGVADLLFAWHSAARGIVYLTGRPERFRDITRRKLAEAKLPVDDAPLLMRPDISHATSTDFKANMYVNVIRPKIMAPGDTVSFVLEDNHHLVRMWREDFSLTTLQPRNTDF